MALPAEYTFGKVVARVVQSVADGSDVNRYPDMRAASGIITFKPKDKNRKTTDYSALVLNQNIKGRLYSPGINTGPESYAHPPGSLIDEEGNIGVWLVTGTYVAEFQLNEGAYPPVEFTLTDDYNSRSPLDLIHVTPTEPPHGVVMVTTELPPGGGPGQTLVRNTSGTLEWRDFIDDSFREVITDSIENYDLNYLVHKTPGKNLINPKQLMHGIHLDHEGKERDDFPHYVTTDYIPVKQGVSYVSNRTRSYVLYDYSKTLVFREANLNYTTEVIVPEQDGYLRVYTREDRLSDWQVEKGDAPTEYETYREYLEDYVNIQDVNMKAVRDIVRKSEGVVPENLIHKTIGLNLIDPEELVYGAYIHVDGELNYALDTYVTTGFIRVHKGQPYVTAGIRGYGLYDIDKEALESYRSLDPDERVITPEQDGYLRAHKLITELSGWQIEKGVRSTPYRPYVAYIDDSIKIRASQIEYSEEDSRYQTFELNKEDLQITTTLDTRSLVITATLNSGTRGQGLFDWRKTILDGEEIIRSGGDEIAPAATQQGTIGANHGFRVIGWEPGTHGKSKEDVGSKWTDGTYEYALLQLDINGVLYGSRKYVERTDGSMSIPSTMPENLVHVSGATNTETLSAPTAGSIQMWPSTKRIQRKFYVDGVEYRNGNATGVELKIKETYDILEFSSLYDLVTENIGVPYEELPVETAMRLESQWIVKPHGKIIGEFHLTEITPTDLVRWSGLHGGGGPSGTSQSNTLYLPGVKPIEGRDFSSGVQKSDHTSSIRVTHEDLIHPKRPPTALIESSTDYGLVTALDPWYKDGSLETRLNDRPLELWFLATPAHKPYPRGTGNRAPGWGRLSIRGARVVLTKEELNNTLVYSKDPLMVWNSINLSL